MMRETAHAALTGSAAIATLGAAFHWRHDITFMVSLTTRLGYVIVSLGMGIVLWAAFYLRSGITGFVTPRTDHLTTAGPYRFVRHPIYLGMAISLVGACLALRSWPGLITVAAIFLPAEVHRARAEERALQDHFGPDWERYKGRTPFFVPGIRRPTLPDVQPGR